MQKLEMKAFIGMSRALNKINRATNKIYKKYNLTEGQFAVLEVLYHKGDLCVGDVQEKILSTTGTIPIIIKNLEKEDLLIRKRDEVDKRKYMLSITKKGKELISEVYPENEDEILSMMNRLDKKELENLISYMKKIGGIDDGEKNTKHS